MEVVVHNNLKIGRKLIVLIVDVGFVLILDLDYQHQHIQHELVIAVLIA